MILFLCSYLFKKLLDAKKLIYKIQDNNQLIHKSKSCRAAEEFCKFSMERKAGLASNTGGSLTGVLGSENPSSSSMYNWVVHRSLFPRKEEIIEWLSHISRVRNLGVVHSHMLRHFLHHLHGSKLVLCDGNLHHMMLAEIPSHHFHHVPDLDWDVHSSQKNSRDCFSHLDLY